jgi:peptidoglycan/LPS O-acetylase OafA/YrhL
MQPNRSRRALSLSAGVAAAPIGGGLAITGDVRYGIVPMALGVTLVAWRTPRGEPGQDKARRIAVPILAVAFLAGALVNAAHGHIPGASAMLAFAGLLLAIAAYDRVRSTSSPPDVGLDPFRRTL